MTFLLSLIAAALFLWLNVTILHRLDRRLRPDLAAKFVDAAE